MTAGARGALYWALNPSQRTRIEVVEPQVKKSVGQLARFLARLGGRCAPSRKQRGLSCAERNL